MFVRLNDHRDMHKVFSWDEKASGKIQKALEEEILTFTKEVQAVCCINSPSAGLGDYACVAPFSESFCIKKKARFSKPTYQNGSSFSNGVTIFPSCSR